MNTELVRMLWWNSWSITGQFRFTFCPKEQSFLAITVQNYSTYSIYRAVDTKETFSSFSLWKETTFQELVNITRSVVIIFMTLSLVSDYSDMRWTDCKSYVNNDYFSLFNSFKPDILMDEVLRMPIQRGCALWIIWQHSYVLPSVFTIVATPLKKPLNLGFGCVWSWMNLTLTVSIGHTITTASATPAPNPHVSVCTWDNLPLSSASWFFKYSNVANLQYEESIVGQILL